MKAKVGSSILKNSFDAGVETAKMSLNGIKNPKIGFLFTSVKYNQKEVLRGIKSVEPELNIIGMTSSDGIMTPDGIITSENGFAGMLVLEDNELKVSVAGSECGSDPRETGRSLAKEALEKSGKKYSPTSFAMFASPKEEEQYLKGIQDVLGDIPMFGGSANDDATIGEWSVLCNDKSYKSGCVIALLYSNKEIKTIFTHDYKETANVGIINEVEDGYKIIEIDGVPALKKYAEWNGFNHDELMGQNLMIESAKYPLGFKTIQGECICVKHPIIGYPDYSFTIDSTITNNIATIGLKSDIDTLIGGTVKTIKRIRANIDPAALLLIHNGFRKKLIGERLDEDFVAIKNSAGEIPFIVTFSFKEYGEYNHSGAMVNGLSLSFTGFSK